MGESPNEKRLIDTIQLHSYKILENANQLIVTEEQLLGKWE